jgi:hypothetical protein
MSDPTFAGLLGVRAAGRVPHHDLRQIGIGVAGRARLDIVGRYRGRAARLFHTV